MKLVASMEADLNTEERNLLSVAYKNVIGARRASWRIISSLEQKEESKSADNRLQTVREYRKTVRHLLVFSDLMVDVIGYPCCNHQIQNFCK